MIRLIADDTWDGLDSYLRQATRKRAAIAYIGSTAVQLLDLVDGDLIIMDGSDAALGAGLVDPDVIDAWLAEGVEVRSLWGLHAKVMLLEGRRTRAVVGSANASAAPAISYGRPPSSPTTRACAPRYPNSWTYGRPKARRSTRNGSCAPELFTARRLSLRSPAPTDACPDSGSARRSTKRQASPVRRQWSRKGWNSGTDVELSSLGGCIGATS
ncbi:hypothetical protein [Micromonospora aurantiaca (nom. illeg.)]|uniref:hypothetical protein n=1 Tax=Micromonospora aurantiaca (nom. illeg.) TaxID=47850 RepID=UPI003F4A2164